MAVMICIHLRVMELPDSARRALPEGLKDLQFHVGGASGGMPSHEHSCPPRATRQRARCLPLRRSRLSFGFGRGWGEAVYFPNDHCTQENLIERGDDI